MKVTVWLEGIGVVGPGLVDWPSARSVLRGEAHYQAQRTVVPAPTTLPAAERRRAGTSIRAAIAVAASAVEQSQRDAASLATVFTASGADGENCHAICEALASSDRQLSPTRFHNSVHNAPSGYWTIAVRTQAASTSLCAHDGSFAAGLLEATLQAREAPILFVAYDTSYPSPMHECRPIPDVFAVAFVLAPERTERALASLSVDLVSDAADLCAEPAFEAMRRSIPSARALTTLSALALKQARRVIVEYLGPPNIALDVVPLE